MPRHGKALSWYATHLGPSVDKVTAGRVGAIAARRCAVADDLIISQARFPGVPALMLMESLLRREPNRLVLLEFIREQPRGLHRLYDYIYGWMLRSSVRTVHVLTEAERTAYTQRYRLPPGAAVFVPWPLADESGLSGETPVREEGRVVASGRAACDWETLFAAAIQSGWNLTAICGAKDLETVRKLNTIGARVLTDIPADQHLREVAQAEIYVLPLEEKSVSSGHIRLMNAISVGTPVVAADVQGLQGYAVEGETALLYPPGDWKTLSRRVDELLENPQQASDLAKRATQSAQGQNFRAYFEELRNAIL